MLELFSSEKIDWFWRVALAHSVIFFLFMLGLISFSIPMSGAVRPFFILMAIYYWAINRPTLIHPFFVFIYGIIFDSVLGFPIGIHSLLFLTVQWVIKRQRSFFLGQTYLVVWMGFAMTSLSVVLIEWLFFSVIAETWLNIKPMFFSFLITVLSFPIGTLIFIAVHRILPVKQKSYF